MSSYNNKNISEKKIKIAEFSLKLINKKGEMKIGKINDTFNSERVLIEKEANLKSFKLTEKKFNDEKIKFTGNLMSEQTSKYLLFNTKSGSTAIEIFPADDWFMFKKDINYKTINYMFNKYKNNFFIINYFYGRFFIHIFAKINNFILMFLSK